MGVISSSQSVASPNTVQTFACQSGLTACNELIKTPH